MTRRRRLPGPEHDALARQGARDEDRLAVELGYAASVVSEIADLGGDGILAGH